MKYCPFCGALMDDEAVYCSKCGKEYQDAELRHVPELEIRRPRIKPAALVFGLLALLALAAAAVFLRGDAGRAFVKDIRVRLHPFSEDTEAISKASSSVVMLACYDESGEPCGTGSGFAMFEDGVIVTNYHVVAQNVYSVAAKTEQGLGFMLDYVIAADESNDIAILKTKAAANVPLLECGDAAELERGDKVVAIGSPLGLINTVSTGVYSGDRSDEDVRSLQFTAAISHGSSGGPLFNNSGEVIGITSAYVNGGQSLNLAIPIDRVQELWEAADEADKMTIPEFYGTFAHVYAFSVEYVMENYDKLDGQHIVLVGYVAYKETSEGEKSIDISASPDIFAKDPAASYTLFLDGETVYIQVGDRIGDSEFNTLHNGDLVLFEGDFSVYYDENDEHCLRLFDAAYLGTNEGH